ncbi:cobalamin-binding protein [Candidatus Acetothermia bacterium]|nr:cobalamin-binding protein [Candidatus Acetothermia bacterium]
MRILSLLPSATEIVCELGLSDSLVGISHDCDWPPEIKNRPVLSEAVVHSELSSDEIDQIVREALHNGMSVYHLDPEQFKVLQPDLILTQELCEVCAPSFDDVRMAAKILDSPPQIVSLEPHRVSEILENISLVGQLTKRTKQAKKVIAGLQTRIDQILSRADEFEEWPRVLCLEWLSPLFIAGHWVPEMVEWAGGVTMGEPGEPSLEISWNDVENFDPEIIILMPCGFTPERTARELDLLTNHESWGDLRAIKNDQVFITHGSYYFNRPGPRVVTGLEILATIIHPEIFAGLEIPEGALYRWEDAW